MIRFLPSDFSCEYLRSNNGVPNYSFDLFECTVYPTGSTQAEIATLAYDTRAAVDQNLTTLKL